MSRVMIHRKDDISDKDRLSTINLDFKSLYGEERLSFARIYEAINNNNRRTESINRQMVKLQNLTKNLNGAALAIIHIDGNYYKNKYGSWGKYNELARNWQEETGGDYIR